MTSTLAPAPPAPAPASALAFWAEAASLAVAAGGGLLVGVLTAYWQGQLPADVSSVTNSCGPWVLAAFLLSFSTSRAAVAALAGTLSLGAMTWGYYAADMHRGYPVSSAHVLFWLAAAVAIGPVAGATAAWLRSNTPRLAALGVGGLAGLCVGEGRYGLTYLVDTTSPVFWKLEMVAGFGLLALGVLRVRRVALLEPLVALMAAAAVALVFPAVYAAVL